VSAPTEEPEGFVAVRRGGEFGASLGPLYVKRDGAGAVLAIRIGKRHLNSQGVVHGGFLLTFADIALGMAVAEAQQPPEPARTVNLTADFLDVAKDGDLIEARVDLQKVGRRLAFASCQLWVGERRILRASGVLARKPPVTPA
jgi:uncharacterized protein (TIGR00369 family)